jgi:predicted amidohydrolase
VLALVQMHCPKGDVTGNLAAIEGHLREAVARGVEILCFPEMSITGYIDPERWPEAVLSLDHSAVARFTAMTAGTDVLAIAGLVEANPGGNPFITQIAARGGALVAVYRKITVVDEEAAWFAPGPGAGSRRSHPAGPVGLAICADIDNAELFQRLAAAGARIVVEAAAPGLYGEQATRDWSSGYAWWRGECHAKLGGYAREHGIAIAVATQAGRTVDEDFPGGGFLFGADGRCLAETADWSPGVLYAEIPAAHAAAAPINAGDAPSSPRRGAS